MTNPPSPPWKLQCPWCDWHVWVSARGQHEGDPGSGVEAALIGERHAEKLHGRTWREFLAAVGDK